MSIRICYLERGERGALLRGVRVVGASSDERWDAPAPDTPNMADPDAAARDAAAWIRDHLGAGDDKKQLHRLGLDADGGVCGWGAARENDSRLLEALVRERSGEQGAAPSEFDAGAGPPRFPDLPGETAIEPLLAPSGASSQAASSRLPWLGSRNGESNGTASAHGVDRAAVLTQPDVPGRTLMDRLDELGVDVIAPISIWHAAAAAWDPAARPSSSSPSAPSHTENGHAGAVEGEVASDQVPVAATVLTDHAGRLVWCWSISGALLAAGSIRLPRHESAEGGAPGTRITQAALHRLSAEWLAWSIQLGMTPQRVRLISDFSGAGTLDPSACTRLIAAACPDAIGETIDEPDPVGLTLRRLAERIDSGATPAAPSPADGRQRLPTLSARPTRAHRRMHRAAAAALFAASIALAAWAWRLDAAAEPMRARAAGVSGELTELIEASGVAPVVNMTPEQLASDRDINNILGEARNLIAREVRPPEGIEPFKPVMNELEAISFIIQSQADLTLESVSITQSTATLRVIVPDASAFEDITRTLESLADTRISWTRPSPIDAPGRGIRVTLTGIWADNPQNSQ